jgi:hypothetical protein
MERNGKNFLRSLLDIRGCCECVRLGSGELEDFHRLENREFSIPPPMQSPPLSAVRRWASSKAHIPFTPQRANFLQLQTQTSTLASSNKRNGKPFLPNIHIFNHKTYHGS